MDHLTAIGETRYRVTWRDRDTGGEHYLTFTRGDLAMAEYGEKLRKESVAYVRLEDVILRAESGA